MTAVLLLTWLLILLAVGIMVLGVVLLNGLVGTPHVLIGAAAVALGLALILLVVT